MLFTRPLLPFCVGGTGARLSNNRMKHGKFEFEIHWIASIDLDILPGRWLMEWLPIVNSTGASGVASWLIMVDISYPVLHKRIREGSG